MSVRLSMTVNGKPVTAEVTSRTLLVDFLRDQLRLTGTHIGCDTAQCGACTIHMNGRAVKCCNMLARNGQCFHAATGLQRSKAVRLKQIVEELHIQLIILHDKHGLGLL